MSDSSRRNRIQYRYDDYMNKLYYTFNPYVPLCTVIVVVCTIIALVIASISLKEAAKVRKDSFLPIILADNIGVESHTSDRSAGANLTNYGKGLAKNITVNITSFNDTLKIRYLKTQRPYDWKFFIDAREINNKSFPNKIRCVIKYHDIFDRQAKTIYYAQKVEFEIRNRKFWKLVFDLDNPRIILP